MTIAVAFAFFAILLWACSNFIDKLLLSRYATNGSVSVLMVFSGLIGLVAAPIYYLFDNSVLSVAPLTALLLFCSGLLYGIAIWCYLKALSDDDTSTVMPLIQIMPVIVLVLSFFILGEELTLKQILLSLGIILGGVLLTIDIHNRKFKWSLALWMLSGCLLWSLYAVLNKYFSLEDGFFITGFWQSISLLAIGIVLLIKTNVRTQFFAYVTSSGKSIVGLNVVNEVINLLGNGLFLYAGLFLPLALLSLAQVYQTALVFIIGFLLTIFVPHIIKEDISQKVLIQKIVSLVIMATASYFLFT